MNKILIRSVFWAAVSCMGGASAMAQTNITQWNFNSVPPDNATATGTMLPALGTGTISGVGGTTTSYASGTANGGSSDPATSDNSGLNLSAFPAQGTANKTAGLEFMVSTLGYEHIQISFDQRNSNTAPAHIQLQYTLDASISSPVWVDADTASASAGSVWDGHSFNLSTITGLDNNPNAGFRIVAAFAPGSTDYSASSSSSAYGTSGTWRLDMLTVKGDTLTAGTTPNLVITEIIHSPNDIEMIEVYNAGSSAADLTGLYFTNGTSGNFPAQTLAAGATVLFSTNPTTAASLLGGTYHLLNSGLGSSSDILVIKNAAGLMIDSVAYQVGSGSWPAAPAGTYYGYSIELNDAALDNNNGQNWTATTQNIVSSASGPILATPGVYPPPAPNPAPVVLSYTQNSATSTSLKFNQSITAATAGNTAHYVCSPGLAVTGALLVGNDSVVLTHAALVDGTAYTLAINGVENANGLANIPDTADLIWNQSMPDLVITEIIHSPNDIEMIEVYNAGTNAAALGGLRWTDGTGGTFPVMSLAAGDNVVFATSPTTASSTLSVPSVYMLSAGLSSSDDILVIRNTLDQVVDSVHYFVGTNGWPTAPSGLYGYAVELTAATLDNNIGSNWTVPLQEVNPQPSAGVVRATPGIYPPPPVTPTSALVSFVSSTVMAKEQSLELQIVANLTGGIDSPAAVDLELIPGAATAIFGTDFSLPAVMTFEWPAGAHNVNDTITITLIDDNIPENAEYFGLRFANPVHVTLPSGNGNICTGFILDDDKLAPVATKSDFLTHVSSYQNHTAGSHSAEIVAYDPPSKRLFIANSVGGQIDIVDFQDPAMPTAIAAIAVNPTYGNINSVAVHNSIVAAAVEDLDPQSPGKIVFFDTNGVFLNQVTVGAMPDMITFTHDGTKVLVANEGEPKSDYSIDPEGSVSIVDISGGIAGLTQNEVTTAGFQDFNTQEASLKAAGVRIYSPGATVAEDMEPEYITVSSDNQTAWVTCQENNAIAVIDLSTATITGILPLGLKDHSLVNHALDANDQVDSIAIANWPVKGMYMPDAIASYSLNGQTYLITANEGDAREYDAYEEAVRLGAAAYVLDSASFPNAAFLKANLARLNVTTATGDTDGDGDFDEIHVFGARSFSIWNATTGALVSDNGMDFELITAQHPELSAIFNASNSNNTFKNRSDDKGPEPEGVTVATIDDKVYAFIALERIGGCMVYDVTDPAAPVYVDYKNTRDIAAYGGDNGSEGIMYIDSLNSPTGKPYVILANEVSSTLSIFEVKPFGQQTSVAAPQLETFCYAFPNPAGSEVHLLVDGAVQNALISIVDINGKVVQTRLSNSQHTILDIQTLPAGTYFLHYTDASRKGTVKVQKL